jgi:NAD+ diphosphatase
MSETSYWLLRHQNQLLITFDENGQAMFPKAHPSEFGNEIEPILVGEWEGVACYATDFTELPPHIEGQLTPVRSLFSLAGPELFSLAGRATQLMDWKKNHRFCGHCATPTVMKLNEFGMECPSCRFVVYPRISPAVMELVRRGRDELLLARSPHFKPGVFSALAGFVEAGETLEECARREVMEEVGVKISQLEYFQSQSWPFPNSLMIAFFAEYESGEISPDPSEIEAADWFHISDLPTLPDPVSIARRLIEAAINAT